MAEPFTTWRPLIPGELGQIPESPGVFEIGTLVRSLLFVGAAPQSLIMTLNGYILEVPPQLHQYAGGLYFRVLTTSEPERTQDDLLARYRDCHGGSLPPAQSISPPPRIAARHLKAV